MTSAPLRRHNPRRHQQPSGAPSTPPERKPVSTYVLIPGAGGSAWYWHPVVALLQAAGHEAIAVDLPADDESGGLPEYTRLVAEAIGDRDDVVLAAMSLGGFTAPMVA